MSFDVGFKGRYVFYVNFASIGNGTLEAEASQNFNFSSLINSASDYAVSVERARIPLQRVPMYPAELNSVQILMRNGDPPIRYDMRDSFSINEWLEQMASIGNGFAIELTSDGRGSLSFTDFTNASIELSPRLAAVLDLPRFLGLTSEGSETFVGFSPIFDRFDQLSSVQIESTQGLVSVQQEIITTDLFATMLVDFLVGSSESMTFTHTQGQPHDATYNLTYPVRADLEFNSSSDRRWVMLKGTAPVQSIRLTVSAIFKDGSRNPIILPPNSLLNIKIAFWKKS